VVIGGVITSTLLTLIVLPTLYERLEQRAQNDDSEVEPAPAPASAA
jgi:Cu/Ag efflux pump CusA